MSWLQLSFDQETRALLGQLTQAVALLTTSIQQQGSKTMAAIDKLTEELAKFTATETALSTAIQAVVTALQADATKIADLTNQIAILNSQGSNDAAIEALLPQFDAVADKLNADANTLQGAVPTTAQP